MQAGATALAGMTTCNWSSTATIVQFTCQMYKGFFGDLVLKQLINSPHGRQQRTMSMRALQLTYLAQP